MGTVFDLPDELLKELKDVEEGGLSRDEKIKGVEEFIEKVEKLAKEKGKGKYAGKRIEFSVGDGKAVYIVYKLKPVQLIHVPVWDGRRESLVHSMTAQDVITYVGFYENSKRFE